MDRIKEKMGVMEQRCRQLRVPLTAQRRYVYEELASRIDHPTADQLFDSLQVKDSGLSRTTVYRALETMEQMGLLRRIPTPEARARFDADTSLHYHFICESCDRIFDLHVGDAQFPHELIVLPEGFLATDSTMTVTGRCSHCRDQL